MSSWKTLSKPLEVVVSDMTCFYVKGKYYELTFYFDAFTKEILSYALANKRGDTKQYYDGLKDLSHKADNSVFLHFRQTAVHRTWT